MPVAAFRTLLAGLLGVPSVATAPLQAKAFAPGAAAPKHKTASSGDQVVAQRRATACVRVSASSLAIALRTCVRTVSAEM